METLKNLEALKDEIAHLEEAAELVEIFENCFPSYYEFKDFVEKNKQNKKFYNIGIYKAKEGYNISIAKLNKTKYKCGKV